MHILFRLYRSRVFLLLFMQVLAGVVPMLAQSPSGSQGQGIYFSKKASVSFFSKARIENIEADNKNVVMIADLAKGKIQLEVLMKAFEFEKKLMQQHFNENYVESDTYPKAVFKGQLVTPASLDPLKEGEYAVKVKGYLTLHGVTKPMELDGKLKIAGGKIMADSEFLLQLSDYNIKIPHIVEDNISNKVRITLNAVLDPFK
ncbi:YceI family protein [Flavitalea flava]